MTQYTNLPDNKHRLYGGAYSIHDSALISSRDQFIREFTQIDSGSTMLAESIKQEFVETYQGWMFEGFNFKNTNLYKHACFTQGTTESFAHFYIRYRNGYRLRLKKADYFYHQMMKSLWYSDKFSWLDEDKIRPGDVVLVSLPFSDTGDKPEELDQLLDDCDQLGVPVMLDLAYLNLATGQSFTHVVDLGRPCIKYVVTSLSKVFPVENLRIGIRLQKEFFEDQLYVINETNYNYINLLSAFVGLKMMQEYKANHVFNQYRTAQLEICTKLNLTPSPCVTLGIDHRNRYPEYNRGGHTNRLCFSRMWDGRYKKLNLVE